MIAMENYYLEHGVRKKPKYVARIGTWPHYRYFYSQEEYQRHLQGEREKAISEQRAKYLKKKRQENATLFGDKRARKEVKKARKKYQKAESTYLKLNGYGKYPNYADKEATKAYQNYLKEKNDYEAAIERYNDGRKIDDLPQNIINKGVSVIKKSIDDPDSVWKVVRFMSNHF